jgi:hypothetical protein
MTQRSTCVIFNYFKNQKMKNFILLSLFIVFSKVNVAQTQKGQSILGEASGDNSGSCVSMPDPQTIGIGAWGNTANGNLSGHARVYFWNGLNWEQKGQDIDGSAGDSFGRSLSMPNSNTIGVGARSNPGGGFQRGRVGVFEYNSIINSWTLKGNYINGEADLDQSGQSVFMPDENTIAIGAMLNDGNGSSSGHVRVFVWNGLNWTQKGSDIDGTVAGDAIGGAISMPDSNTIAIGAHPNDFNGANAGQVRIFEWNGNNWIQKGVSLYGDSAGDEFGFSVSMPTPNILAASSRSSDDGGTDVGKVEIFEWNGTNWIQKGPSIIGDPLVPLFGGSISMANPDVISIGAIGSPASNSGRVGVYFWNGVTWLLADNYIVGDNLSDGFGTSVSMGAYHTVGIGANFNNLNTGQVKIYEVCVPTTTIESITACDSIDWIDGNTYLTSGTYSFNATSVLGCDSTVLLNLTINNGSSSIQNETALNSFFWTINGQTYTQSGNYTGVIPSANGCDSVITLNLTLNFTGINQEEYTDFTLFPNPATDQITINGEGSLIGKTYLVFDQVGKVVFKGSIDKAITSLSVTNFSNGVYTLQIDGQGRRTFVVRKE